MAFFTEDEIDQFKEHGFIGKPGVVDRMLLDKAADRFYEPMEVDRNDPETFINAGPPSQNLKAGLDPAMPSQPPWRSGPAILCILSCRG